MAEKKFNTVGGLSVGSPGNVIDVIDNFANVYANRIFVTQYSNLGDIANVYIGGGTNNQVLKTDGAGGLYWGLDTAPAGGNTAEVQFNDGGSLAGSSTFSFDKVTNLLTLSGNISTDNAQLGNLASANYFSGNGSLITYITGANVTGAVATATNAVNVTANAQPNITSVGSLTSTTFVSNANVTLSGTLSQITGANVVSATYLTGTLTTSAQPNITSLGTLSSLSVAANVTSGNASLGNLATANYFSGDGSLLTGVIDNANYAAYAGNITIASQPNITSLGTLASVSVTGITTATGGIKTENIQDLSGSDTIKLKYNTNAGDVGVVANLTVGSSGTGNLKVNGISDLGPVGNVKITGGFDNAVLTTNGAGVLSWETPNYANYAGTVTSAAQPNITSLGTLSSLSAGDTTITGNLTVNGTTSNLSVSSLVVQDNMIDIGAETVGTPSQNSGFRVIRGDDPSLQFRWNESAANWQYTNDGFNYLNLVGKDSVGNVTVGNLTATNLTGTLTTAVQPNITSVGTLASLSVTANVTAGNLTATNHVSGTTLGGTLTTAAQPNITSVGTLVNTTMGSANSLTGGNLVSATYLTGTLTTAVQPNITSVGTLVNTTMGSSNSLTGGNLVSANYLTGTLTTSVQPNITSVGTLVDTTMGSANSLTGGNLVSATYLTGTLTTAIQPNITSVGTLASLSVTANVTAGNLTATNHVSGTTLGGTLTTAAQPNITSVGTLVNTTMGSSNSLTGGNLVSANYLTGTLTTAAQPNVTSVGTLASTTMAANATLTLSGAASQITGSNLISANYFTGTLTTAAQPNITSVGLLADANVNGNVLIGGNLVVNGTTTYVNVDTLAIEDPIIELGGGPNNAPLSIDDNKDRGSLLHYYTTKPVDAFMGWDNSNNEFGFGSNVSVSGEIVTWNEYGNIRANYFLGSGEFLTGTIAQANYAAYAGNVTIAAQPNITSVGTLVNTTMGSANSLSGGNLVSANYLTGTLTTAVQPNITSVGTLVNTTMGSANSLTGGNLVSATYLTGTLTTAVQPNITSVGSLASLTVTGLTTATGGVKTANIIDTSGTITLQTKYNGVSGDIGVVGNIVAGTGGTGNVTATYFVGNGAALSHITAANVTGQVANALIAGTVYTNAQPNITSVGILNGVTATGTVNLTGSGNISLGSNANVHILGGTTGQVLKTDGSGNLYWALDGALPGGSNSQLQFNDGGAFNGVPGLTFDKFTNTLSIIGNVETGDGASGNITGANYVVANYFVGDGSLLTGITTSSYSNANVASYLPTYTGDFTAGNANVTGNITAAFFIGNGSQLTGLPASYANANVAAYLPTYTGNFTAGNANVTGNVTASFFIGDGSQLTGLPASYSNVNVAAYLPTYTGNFTAGNANVSGSITAGNANVAGTIIAGTGSGGSITGANLVSANFFTGNGTFLSSISAANISGQVANALIAATVTSNAQPNITSVGVLSALNVSGNAIITGNLIVSGTAEYTNVNNLYIQDPIIELGGNSNAGALTANDGKDRGTLLHYYTTKTVDAFMGWDNSNGEFAFGSNVSTSSDVVTFNTFGNVRASYFLGNASQLVGTIANANFAAYAGVVTTAAQPNITSVGTLASLSVTANVSAGNILTNNLLYANGVVWNFGSTYSNSNAAAYLPTYTGNFTAGNVNVTGNITSAYFIGNGSQLTGLPASYANSNVAAYLPTYTGNFTAGNANVSGNVTASYFIGNGSALTSISGGNVTGQVANALIAGTVYTNAQPNITSVGTLSNLTVTGNATVNGTVLANALVGTSSANVTITAGTYVSKFDEFGTVTLANNLSVPGNITSNNANLGNAVTANFFVGDGSLLTGLAATYSNTNVADYLPTYTGNFTAGNANVTGNVTASFFIGNGSQLTGLPASYANANVAAYLPTYTGDFTAGNANVTGNVTASFFIGNGSQLTGLPASYANANVAAYLPTYTGNVAASYFIGNGATLTNIAGGNVDGQVSNSLIAGTVYTNAQPNITSVGTLSALTVDGLSDLGPIENITITGGDPGQVLRTNGSGALSWVDQTGGGSLSGFVSMTKDRYLTTGSANTFSLSTTPSSKNFIEVVIDGLQQISNTYSLTGSILSFPTNPASGQVIEVTSFGAVDLTGNVGEVAFNSGNALGASSAFTFTTGTNTLSVGNLTVTGNLTSQGGYVYVDAGIIAVASGNAGVFNTGIANINLGLAANVTIGSTTGNTTIRGNLSANNASLTNLSVNNYYSSRDAVTVTTDTIIDQFPISSYRSAKYTMRVNSDDGYQAVEVLLVHDGSSSYVTIYGSISSSGSDIITMSSNIGSGNIRLFASTASTNTTVKILGTYVPD